MKRIFYFRLLCGLCSMVFFHQFVAHAQEVATTHQARRDANPGQKVRALKAVLAEMERKYNVRFSFDSDLLEDKYESVSKQLSGNVEQALRTLLTPHQLDFQKINKRYYTIFSNAKEEKAVKETSLNSIPLPPATRMEPLLQRGSLKLPRYAFLVSGSVADGAGQPMSGVNILEKGTANGTVSDEQGKFRLQVTDEKAVLVISYIGFTTEEIPVNGRPEIQTKLLPDLLSLSEVVVVGYGTQKQREVTGAVSSVSSKDISGVVVTGLDQAMQGRMAGVQVTQNSGEPGGRVSVRVRGVGSITGGNEPLYIVDGVPYGNLNAINPNDIERIDVLKDAASAAIYGSRGTNGVVIVTTKRAKAGQLSVNLDAYAGTQSAYRTLDLLDGPQFARLANENLANGGQDPNPAWGNPDAMPSTDWQRELLKRAPIQSYNVTVSGGNEKSRSLLSVGYFDQGGIVSQSYYKRYTARFNTDYNISRKISVGVTLNAAFEEKRGTQTDGGNGSNNQGGLITSAISHPTIPLVAPQDGLFGINPDGSIDPAGNTYYGYDGTSFVSNAANTKYYPAGLSNPVYAYEKLRKNTNRGQQLLAAAYAEYEIIRGLKARSDLNLTFGNNHDTRFWMGAPTALNGRGLYGDQSLFNETWGRSNQWNWINTLSYTKAFGQHNFVALAGIDALRSTGNGINIQTQRNPNDQPFTDGAPQGNRVVSGGAPTPFALVSYLGRVTYDYAGKYLLTANIRRDGSSNFNPDGPYQYGIFPSASVGWLLSEENFMRSVSFVSQLKLRASYGTVGNQGIPAFQYLSIYGNEGNRRRYPLGVSQDLVVGTYPVNQGEADIRWEKSTQTDIGIDASFLNNKFTLTTDYYIKDISDMLGLFPVPSYLGLPNNAILRNGFSMTNSGIEIALGYNQRIGGVNFSTSANFSTLHNKVTKLTGNETGFVSSNISAGADGGANTRTEVGQRIGNFYGYVADGIAQNADEAAASGIKDLKPGDRLYRNLDTSAVINDKDRTIIGNGLPKYIFGFSLNADYKGFDISVLLNGQAGVQIANQTRYWLNNMKYDNSQGGISNASTDLLNSWTEEGSTNTHTRNAFDAAPSNRWFSTFNIENGAFLRVRNVQIGYTLPEALSRKAGMARARLYIAAQNLHTFTKYSGYDPELGSRDAADSNGANSRNGNALQTGVDFGRYPVARMFTGGINIQF